MKKLLILFLFLSSLAYGQTTVPKTYTATGTDTYAITESYPATYTTNENFYVRFQNQNTGAATLNRAGLGAKDIKSAGGTALSAGEIKVGTYLLNYNGTYYQIVGGGGGGAGTVQSVSVTTANGVSGSVATATTTPAITLTLGAITPSSVAASGTVTGSNLLGTNTGDQTNISGNSATVTTNADLTGPITSTGNATAIASQTGTGSTFAMSAGPTFTGTPAAPTASVGTNTTQLATTAFVVGQALGVASAGVDGYLSGTDWSTFNGKQDNLTVNTPNLRTVSPTWTATTNNQYHLDFSGQFTARATASDNLFSYKDTHTLIAGAATQDLFSRTFYPTYNINGQSGIDLVGLDYFATISGTPSTHTAIRVRNGVSLFGTSTATGGLTGLQINGTGTTSGLAFVVNNATPSTRFYVQENGISVHTSTFTTSGTGQSGLGINGTITGRASNPDRFFSWLSTASLSHQANSQTGVVLGLTGSMLDGGFTGTTGIGILFEPSSAAVDNVYPFISANANHFVGLGIAVPTATIHVVGTAKIDANLTLPTAGNKLVITEGSNGSVGQTALVTGTKAITVSGVTTSSRCFVTLVSPNTTSLTSSYQCVCTTNTVTLQANVAAGTINVDDISTLNYWVIN